ncbi:gamma-interferon-inducible lysosomal thiol reductase-like [Palaemon carinicauda]|uniref:gamma-interferon-inducible lysosomal thiol reductase-like n=1 Tax=Palaemon carinicauda TaxID=392227 RepID=UPI0035B5BF9C
MEFCVLTSLCLAAQVQSYTSSSNKNKLITMKLYLLMLVAASSVQAFKLKEDKVKVLLYDDPDCHWCQLFMTEQLQPTFKEIGDIMEVEVNTYGFTQEPYEAGEFINNRIMECAQLYTSDTGVFLDFAACFMPDPHDGSGCASKFGIDWNTISTCAEGDEGINLLHEAGVREDAQEPVVWFYPWIAINGVGPNTEAQDNLKAEVCKAYTGTPPPACST